MVGRKKIASVLTAWPSLVPTPHEEGGGWVGGSRIAVVLVDSMAIPTPEEEEEGGWVAVG